MPPCSGHVVESSAQIRAVGIKNKIPAKAKKNTILGPNKASAGKLRRLSTQVMVIIAKLKVVSTLGSFEDIWCGYPFLNCKILAQFSGLLQHYSRTILDKKDWMSIMYIFPNINPVALSIGPLKVHWYGIMYLLGFAMTWILGAYRVKKPWTVLNSGEQVGDAIF